MGICESAKNKVNGNNLTNSNRNNSVYSFERERETIKYFKESTNLNKQDIILNNDVIVTDSGSNPENIYEKVKLIGEGAFGEVWKVRHKILGKNYAMKIIENNQYCKTKEIFNEIEILKKLDHPNILKILDFHLTNDKFYIITDFCPEGELFNEIKTRNEFSEIEGAFIIHQLLSAIRYCHKMRVIHRDIKLENIMIMDRQDDRFLHVKLIDFGTARIFSEEKHIQKGFVGSSYYIAPEVIKEKYDESCDVWSIGVVMYIILTGVPPFNGKDEDSILNQVSSGKYDTTIDSFVKLSENAKDLIKKLLKFNPKERITARDAINHPWFQTKEFLNTYQRINTVNPFDVREMIKNLEKYKSDNIIKCAVLAYLVHQNTNIPQCLEITKLFKDIDLNHDGKLEPYELNYAYNKYFGLNSKEASNKTKLIFSNIDTDNNGYIECEEFIRACIDPKLFNSKNFLLFAFNYFDNDRAGFITINKIENKFFQNKKNINKNSKKELKELFDQIDINHDGKISFNEFSLMINSIINN